MTTFHPAYGQPAETSFRGTRDELRGGELLGGTARHDLFEPGDIVTCVRSEGATGFYYYDPELRIEGDVSRWVRLDGSGERSWQALDYRRAAS